MMVPFREAQVCAHEHVINGRIGPGKHCSDLSHCVQLPTFLDKESKVYRGRMIFPGSHS